MNNARCSSFGKLIVKSSSRSDPKRQIANQLYDSFLYKLVIASGD